MRIKISLILITALLALWLLGLVASQVWVIYGNFRKRDRAAAPKWKRWDYFGLLPRFAFFSWVPHSHFELLYRDKAFWGEITPWNKIDLPARTALRFIWNPGRRKRFALEDLCRSLLSRIGYQLWKSAALSPYSWPYLGLAYHVSQVPSCPLSKFRQFMVAQSFGDPARRPEVLFISPFFR